MSVDERSPAEAFPQALVAAVSCNDAHSFSKPNRTAIELVPGLGVRGDVHAGVTVRHRSRVAVDPAQPNLRQVHLIHAELHDEVRGTGYEVPPGGLGENVTTSGVDLLALPCGTILRFGPPVSTRPVGIPSSEAGTDTAVSANPGAAASPSPSSGAAASPSSPSGAAANPSSPSGAAVNPSPPSGPGPDQAGAGSALAVSSGLGAVSSSIASADAPVFAHLGVGMADGSGLGGGGGPLDVVGAAQRASLDGPTAEAVAVLAAVVEAEAASGAVADGRPAVVITGLRNPCQQINRFRPGLLKEVLGKDPDGRIVRRAGVMGVVLRGGTVRPGDSITVELPAVVPHRALDRV
ncbi:hypothetical protein Asp14428_30520 [Actinoplanes sp. NBRC 14428]|nr:hypothetical protein Asp14428_30520 [Actinoplanes sp. NBRC 14428]